MFDADCPQSNRSSTAATWRCTSGGCATGTTPPAAATADTQRSGATAAARSTCARRPSVATDAPAPNRYRRIFIGLGDTDTAAATRSSIAPYAAAPCLTIR